MARDPFTNTLFEWYELHQRSLPWRNTKDPYKIWLSEIILQQTRVEQGMEYYLKFIEMFPTVHDLAAAEEDVVMKAWQGLGYYSRARNLMATARTVSQEMKGQFPKTAKELESLKGIGPYTAAAIASFAFNEASPVVVGNVLRFLSRIIGNELPIDSKGGVEAVKSFAIAKIPEDPPDTFNQAIMEFGSLQCKPKPLCQSCPFSQNCVAHIQDTTDQIPWKEKKTKVKTEYLYYLVAKEKGEVLLRKRKSTGIWANLYEFPLVSLNSALEAQEVHALFQEQFPTLTVENHHPPVKHLLSHRKLYVSFIEAEVDLLSRMTFNNDTVVPEKEIENFAVPKVIENYWNNR